MESKEKHKKGDEFCICHQSDFIKKNRHLCQIWKKAFDVYIDFRFEEERSCEENGAALKKTSFIGSLAQFHAGYQSAPLLHNSITQSS